MPVVDIAKPGSVTGAIIGGGKFGTAGTDFFMKVDTIRTRFFVPHQETTGDQDSGVPRFDGSETLYFSYSLSGWVLASNEFGVANMIVAAKNPTAALTFLMATGSLVTITATIETCEASSTNKAGANAGVPMIITGRATEVTPTWA